MLLLENVKLKIWFLDDNISFIWSKPFFVLCAWSLLLNKDQEHTCIQISVMPLENVKKKIVCGFIIPVSCDCYQYLWQTTCHLVRKDVDVDEHEKLSNITLRHEVK